LPKTKFNKFQYADDTALACQDKDISNCEKTLEEDLETLKRYFKKWRLKPNPQKTESIIFHLNNRQASTTMNITFDGENVQHNPTPKYLNITLDRSLTYKRHIEKLVQKIKTRNNLLMKLTGTGWGAEAETLRIAAFSLVYSAAEYCAPV